jgi:hypothetical protein
MSVAFRNIDPHPLTAQRACTPSRGRTHSLVGEGWRGVNSSKDARHCSVLYVCKYFVTCREDAKMSYKVVFFAPGSVQSSAIATLRRRYPCGFCRRATAIGEFSHNTFELFFFLKTLLPKILLFFLFLRSNLKP